ncbi:MAG: AlpA family transcriptional regulator [Caldilineae bacterium]|nr:MAG: AlpA family transcriptional regulator [Caldilineae bacterium]
MDRLLRLKSVLDLTGLSRSRVYELIAAGAFPAPVKIGARAVAWRASEIAAWIDSRPPARRASGDPGGA